MENAIQTYQGQSALDIRRTLPDNASIKQNLTNEEYKILQASCKQHLSEMEEADAAYKVKTQLHFVAIETGYHKPQDALTWQYLQTRLYTFLREHYGGLSIEDIKCAFDLLAFGRLDQYLPKNAYGTPDRSHYQQFTPEYFAKVLNAYKQVQNAVISKARAMLPEQKKEQQGDGNEYWNNKLREAYYIYKYRGKLELAPYLILHALKHMRRVHYNLDVEITEQDKSKAYWEYLRQAAHGLQNENEAVYVKRKGKDAEPLAEATRTNAQVRLIQEYFDYLINR